MDQKPQILILRPCASELTLMRAFVDRWAERVGLPAQRRYDACLVATEAVTNAIRHVDGDEAITVRCRVESGVPVIEVQDRGVFGSQPVPRPDVDRQAADLGGRGLFLIRELTREFHIEKNDEGTTLSMQLAKGDGIPAAA